MNTLESIFFPLATRFHSEKKKELGTLSSLAAGSLLGRLLSGRSFLRPCSYPLSSLISSLERGREGGWLVVSCTSTMSPGPLPLCPCLHGWERTGQVPLFIPSARPQSHFNALRSPLRGELMTQLGSEHALVLGRGMKAAPWPSPLGGAASPFWGCSSLQSIHACIP